jgi:hypothetical protein
MIELTVAIRPARVGLHDTMIMSCRRDAISLYLEALNCDIGYTLHRTRRRRYWKFGRNLACRTWPRDLEVPSINVSTLPPVPTGS